MFSFLAHLSHGMQGQLDDVERAINNAVNAFKALTRDARCLAAGGAAEMEVARQLQVRMLLKCKIWRRAGEIGERAFALLRRALMGIPFI